MDVYGEKVLGWGGEGDQLPHHISLMKRACRSLAAMLSLFSLLTWKWLGPASADPV